MNCRICGEEMHEDSFVKDVKATMLEHQMCHTCNFWREIFEEDAKRPPHTWCMIDGAHYIIVPDNPNSYFQGFGGRKYEIEFNDGFRVLTHNLWHQGKPEEEYWKERFPDNARFKDDLKWTKVGNNEYLI